MTTKELIDYLEQRLESLTWKPHQILRSSGCNGESVSLRCKLVTHYTNGYCTAIVWVVDGMLRYRGDGNVRIDFQLSDPDLLDQVDKLWKESHHKCDICSKNT